MEFRTIVDIPRPGFEIGPCDEMLFVGSCFATEIGRRFQEELFPATVNPFGVMYNPVSILHTIQKLFTVDSLQLTDDLLASPSETAEYSSVNFKTVFLTLGTNHIYRLKETGEIVDNCQKRPQSLFIEEELSVEACADYLRQVIDILCRKNPEINIVLTVSPIRYRKYGYHRSQLSKATLLLAVEKTLESQETQGNPGDSRNLRISYFPAYEIVNDELRDYRFYKSDMLHPSEQTVDYIWERLVENYFSAEAKTFLQEWAPLKAVLNHRPFDSCSEEYLTLMNKTKQKLAALKKKYTHIKCGTESIIRKQ